MKTFVTNFLWVVGLLAVASSEDIDPNCKPKIEILLLQDITASLWVHVDNLRKQLPAFFKKVSDALPDAKLACAVFKDKPRLYPDFCLSDTVPLAKDSADTCVEMFGSINVAGGEDWQENQFGSMMRAALSEEVGWGSGDDTWKIMFLSTDSVPHISPDMKTRIEDTNAATGWTGWEYFNKTGRKYKNPNPLYGFDSMANPDAGCDEWEYPTMEEWAFVMWSQKIIPVFMVGDAVFVDDAGNKFIPYELKNLGERFGDGNLFTDQNTGIANFYQFSLNSFNLTGGVYIYKQDMEDFNDLATAAIQFAIDNICDDTPVFPPVGPPTPAPPTTEGPTEPQSTTEPPLTNTNGKCLRRKWKSRCCTVPDEELI